MSQTLKPPDAPFYTSKVVFDQPLDGQKKTASRLRYAERNKLTRFSNSNSKYILKRSGCHGDLCTKYSFSLS